MSMLSIQAAQVLRYLCKDRLASGLSMEDLSVAIAANPTPGRCTTLNTARLRLVSDGVYPLEKLLLLQKSSSRLWRWLYGNEDRILLVNTAKSADADPTTWWTLHQCHGVAAASHILRSFNNTKVISVLAPNPVEDSTLPDMLLAVTLDSWIPK